MGSQVADVDRSREATDWEMITDGELGTGTVFATTVGLMKEPFMEELGRMLGKGSWVMLGDALELRGFPLMGRRSSSETGEMDWEMRACRMSAREDVREVGWCWLCLTCVADLEDMGFIESAALSLATEAIGKK